MATLTPAHEHELQTHGWTVLRGFADLETTAAARALTDQILGGPTPCAAIDLEGCGRRPARGQPGPWPVDGSTLPVIQSAGWRHSIMHPIADRLMARFIPPMAEVYAVLLRCEADALKLLKQQLVRVDAEPEAEQRPTKWSANHHTYSA